MESVLHVLRPRRGFIAGGAILVGALAVAIPLLLHVTKIAPMRYAASIRLQITQRAAFTLDPYTAIRSTELIAAHLGAFVETSSFLKRVLEAGYQVDASYFEGSEQRRRRVWERTVDAVPTRGTGFLRVTAYHPRSKEAVRIVSAVAFLLSTKGSEYVGRDIGIQVVDPPLASRFPVQPNLILNAVAGAAVGAVLAAGWVWVEHRRRKHKGQILG